MRALSTSERRWVTWVSALLLLLTLVPLGVAAARTPAGHDFGGFVYEARDGDSYVGKTMEGVEGHWLYRDPYTSEKQPASFILAPFLCPSSCTSRAWAWLPPCWWPSTCSAPSASPTPAGAAWRFSWCSWGAAWA